MRYEEVDTVSFTTVDGESYELKDMREYDDLDTSISIKVGSGKHLDEIASRDEIYGEDAEYECYKLFNQNKIKLFENGFDVTKLSKLDIPL